MAYSFFFTVLLPPRDEAGWTADQTFAGGYPQRNGTIIDVYPGPFTRATPVAHTRLGAITVTGVPDAVPFEKIKRVLLREGEVLPDSINGIEDRYWVIPGHEVPAQAKATLLSDRRLTVTWTQFKDFVKSLKENRNISDTDVNDG